MGWKRDELQFKGTGKVEPLVGDRRGKVTGEELVLDARRVTRLLFAVLGALLLLFLGGKISRLYIGPDRLLGLLQGVHPYFKATVPTWFVSATLLACAVALAAISWLKRLRGEAFASHWSVLAAAFLVFSMERSTGLLGTMGSDLAERVQMLNRLRVFGSLRITTLIVLFTALFVFYRKLWSDLPKRVRRLAAAAVAAYLFAQLVIDSVQTSYLAQHPDIGYDPLWVLLVATDLLVSASAVILLLLSLLVYLAGEDQGLCVRVR